ncbi:hypothetical protein C882_2273 [Caenispirillum salinarum AK4]|uniref:TRAP transporter small permease protein n=2 Tax=Caenispirillum TaxID=414051 RepID=K9HD75_9PROT|nr:hypothetical protein C882_2273 [Caenispirillum salinarum AK4]
MLVTAAAVLGVLGYAAAALLTVGDVIGRQIGTPIPGMVDLVQLFVLGGAWLVIPYAFMTGAHVGVDLVVDMLPGSVERGARAVASLAAVALLGLMLMECYKAFQMQILFGDKSQQLGIPILYYWVPLLIGVGLSILAALLTLVPRPRTEAVE